MLDEMQQEESNLTLLRDRNKSDQTELNRLQKVLMDAKKMLQQRQIEDQVAEMSMQTPYT